MDFSITGLQFGVGTLLLASFVVGVIVFLRRYLASKNITQQEINTKKYKEFDVFKSTGTFWRFGLLCAVGFTILAFSWTTYQEKFEFHDLIDIYDDEIINDIPPTQHFTPPPPPPPPPPTLVETVEETPEEPPKFTDQTVTKQVSNVATKPKAKKPRPKKTVKPPVKKKQEVIETIHVIVEEMPRFPGCENIGGNYDAKKGCADKKMLEFIYKNIKYPTLARENGVEGTVVISFVVEKDGSITDIKILREPGAGLGEEALRIVEKMQSLPQKWIPGKQGNENVRVQFNLPVKFRLQN